jgi:hypothetical protein
MRWFRCLRLGAVLKVVFLGQTDRALNGTTLKIKREKSLKLGMERS